MKSLVLGPHGFFWNRRRDGIGPDVQSIVARVVEIDSHFWLWNTKDAAEDSLFDRVEAEAIVAAFRADDPNGHYSVVDVDETLRGYVFADTGRLLNDG